MSNTYTNSVAYLLQQQLIDADTVGWVDPILRAAELTQLLPIVPASHFMKDEHFEKKQGGEKTKQTRRLNEEPPARSKNRFVKKSEQTTIFTTRTDIDFKLAQYNPMIYDQLLEDDASELMQDIGYDIVQGVPESDGYGMNGLSNRIAIGGSQDVNDGAALTINTSATTMKKFLNLFRTAVLRVKRGPGMNLVAFVNKDFYLGIQNGRDQLGANVMGVGTVDIMNQVVTSIDGIPLVLLRDDSVGTPILPFGEGGNAGEASIWIVGYGGQPAEGSKGIPQGATLVTSNPGQIIDRYTERLGNQIRTFQEIDLQLRIPTRSVARLSRLKVA